MDAMYITELGMLNDVQQMHAISNNLANSNTAGFKKEIAVARSFSDYLELDIPGREGVAGLAVSRPYVTTATDYSNGALKFTGNPLDLAIEGAGYFVLSTDLGATYTRQGGFRVDENGRLVGANGMPVMGVSGEIRLTTPEPRVDAQGVVWEGGAEVGQIRVVRIDNPQTLVKRGAGVFEATELTEVGEPDSARVRQGFAETANVVLMGEMVKMMETMRHFETSQRVIHSYDTMLDRGINLIGEL